MKKLLIGLSVVTAVATTTGFAAAQNNGTGNRPDLTGYNKDQCKNGGWEDLGFENQGQCVAYFARQQGGRTNNNNVDVNATTNQSSASGSVEVSNNGFAGDAVSGNASNSSSTSVDVSVTN